MKKVLIIFGALFAIYLLIDRYFLYNEKDILKKAIFEHHISDRKYIIAEPDSVTFFHWFVRKNEKEDINEYCFIDLNNASFPGLKYELMISQNEFVFYYETVEAIFVEELNKSVEKYTITDWDILYPVKRDILLWKQHKKNIFYEDMTK